LEGIKAMIKKFKPNGYLKLGLLFLVLANLSHFVLQRKLAVGEDASDFIFGGFMGLAIGLMAVSIFAEKKHDSFRT
jgi:hypothetical protein